VGCTELLEHCRSISTDTGHNNINDLHDIDSTGIDNVTIIALRHFIHGVVIEVPQQLINVVLVLHGVVIKVPEHLSNVVLVLHGTS
jgi:hypothetical protein